MTNLLVSDQDSESQIDIYTKELSQRHEDQKLEIDNKSPQPNTPWELVKVGMLSASAILENMINLTKEVSQHG